MKVLLIRLCKEEQGQDLTEYALLLVLLSLAAVGALGTLARAINGAFSNAAGNLTTYLWRFCLCETVWSCRSASTRRCWQSAANQGQIGIAPLIS